jgi:hypothetical protein
MGNKLKNIETDKAKLIVDIKDLSDGVYFITFMDQSGLTWSRKIIKSAP